MFYSGTSLPRPHLGTQNLAVVKRLAAFGCYFYCGNLFYSMMMVVVESRVVFQSPFVERFDFTCM